MDPKADFFRHSDGIPPANEVLIFLGFICLFIWVGEGQLKT